PPPRSHLFPYTTLFRSLDRYGFTSARPAAGMKEPTQPPYNRQKPTSAPNTCLNKYCPAMMIRRRPVMSTTIPKERPTAETDVVVDRKSTRLNSSHVAIS